MVSSLLNLAFVKGAARSWAALSSFLELVGATLRCAAAVESGRRPNTRDLQLIGIADRLGHAPHVGR